MVFRIFSRRSKYLMITLWKSIIQPKLYYCSQLWSPSDQSSISKLESVMRSYTAKISCVQGADYWDRLAILKMFSQERRRERYQIIFIWKISQGLVKGYSLPFIQHQRRGRIVSINPIKNSVPCKVRRAKESSLQVKGSKLFNLLPALLRNIDS